MAKKAEAAADKTELVVAAAPAGVPATLTEHYGMLNPALAGIIQENIGAGGLKPTDLVRIKIPAGGGLAFEIPTLSGEPEIAQTLEVVILAWADKRAYWAKEFSGENTPPDCASDDCFVGVCRTAELKLGGNCSTCPLSQFGSAPQKNGKASNAQACKQIRPIYFLRKGKGALPMRLVSPPTSVGEVKKFFLQLSSEGIPYYGGEIIIGLKKDKSKDGIEYSKLTFKLARKFNEAEFKAIAALHATMKGQFSNMTVDDVVDQDEAR